MSKEKQKDKYGLAMLLHNIYSSMPKPGHEEDVQMHKIWRQALNVSGSTADLYDALRWITLGIDKIEYIISTDSNLSQRAKGIHLSVIKHVRVPAEVAYLSSRLRELRQHWEAQYLNGLVLIDEYVMRAHPESSPTSELTHELKSKVEELRKIIGMTAIPDLVKASLDNRLVVLLWAIEHWEQLGAEPVFEAAGRVTTTVVRYVPEISTSAGAEKAVPDMLSKLKNILDWSLRADGVARIGSDLWNKAPSLEHFKGLIN